MFIKTRKTIRYNSLKKNLEHLVKSRENVAERSDQILTIISTKETIARDQKHVRIE